MINFKKNRIVGKIENLHLLWQVLSQALPLCGFPNVMDRHNEIQFFYRSTK